MINPGLSGTGQEEQVGGPLFSSLKPLLKPKASPHPILLLSICMFPPLCGCYLVVKDSPLGPIHS